MGTLRGRNKSNAETDTSSRVITSDGSILAESFVTTCTRAEGHLDIKEKFNASRKYPWHPASHVRVTMVPGPRPPYRQYSLLFPGIPNPLVSPVVYGYGGKWQVSNWANFAKENALSMCGTLDNAAILDSAVGGEMIREAVMSITEQMPTQVSIPNFIWELREGIKQLKPKLTGNLVKDIAGGHLWWSFGMNPMVQDIKKMFELSANVLKRFQYLLRVNGTTQTVRYKKRWTRQGTPTPYLPLDDPPDGITLTGSPVIEWQDAFVSMNCRVRYALEGLEHAEAFFALWLKGAGFLNPAGVVWEAIPYSFVVDWFTNASEWIDDNLDVHQPFYGDIQIVGSDHTIKRRTMIANHVSTDNIGGHEAVDRVLIREYHRRGGPIVGTLVEDGLSPAQIILGLSLIAQQLGPMSLFNYR